MPFSGSTEPVVHLHGLTGSRKASCESRLGYIYISMLGVPGQYKSVALMLSYKLNFSCCANKDGFHRDSHICYEATNTEKKHSPYNFATLKQKAKIGKYVAENGTTNVIHHFSKEFPNLKESTVWGWRSVYLLEVKRRTKEDLRVDRIPQGKIGHPLLLRRNFRSTSLGIFGYVERFWWSCQYLHNNSSSNWNSLKEG